ncbi:hypothetical protein V6N13_015902 [Hibiscus sabdariffa]
MENAAMRLKGYRIQLMQNEGSIETKKERLQIRSKTHKYIRVKKNIHQGTPRDPKSESTPSRPNRLTREAQREAEAGRLDESEAGNVIGGQTIEVRLLAFGLVVREKGGGSGDGSYGGRGGGEIEVGVRLRAAGGEGPVQHNGGWGFGGREGEGYGVGVMTGTHFLVAKRRTLSQFDVVTVSELRCCSDDRYSCARVPEKIFSLLFSFSVYASTTQDPKCPELRLNSYGSRKDDSLLFKSVVASILKTTTRSKVNSPRPFSFGFLFLGGLA